MRLIFNSQQKEAVKSLSVVSRNLTRIRDSWPGLTPEDAVLFRYLQLELINAANLVAGKVGAEEVFDSMDTQKLQTL